MKMRPGASHWRIREYVAKRLRYISVIFPEIFIPLHTCNISYQMFCQPILIHPGIPWFIPSVRQSLLFFKYINLCMFETILFIQVNQWIFSSCVPNIHGIWFTWPWVYLKPKYEYVWDETLYMYQTRINRPSTWNMHIIDLRGKLKRILGLGT